MCKMYESFLNKIIVVYARECFDKQRKRQQKNYGQIVCDISLKSTGDVLCILVESIR